MKIVHVPHSYFPDLPFGGVEVYVRSLACTLLQRNIESLICAPGASCADYLHDGMRVRRFTGHARATLDDWYGDGDPVAAAAFGRILEIEKPDVVHLHGLTAAVSLRLAACVKALGLPLVFTYHAALTSCLTGGLVRWGRSTCDGEMETKRCAGCSLHNLGMPRPAASMIGRVPPRFGRFVRGLNVRSRISTALQMSELVERRLSVVRRFLGLADAIVAPSEWVGPVLRANGIDPARIRTCRHAVATPLPRVRRLPGSSPDRALRIAIVARLHPCKGLHVLVEALSLARDLDVSLDVFAGSQPDESAYAKRMSSRIQADPRIHLRPPIENDDVVDTLAGYDVLAVPSQWMETGPLTVLEGFAAGIPVLGSDLGGVSERVAHGVDGLLVPPRDARAWAGALRRLSQEAGLLQRLTRGVRPPPPTESLAAAMDSLYRELAPRAPYPRRIEHAYVA